MPLFCDLFDAIDHARGGAVSIGNFDGVHHGHASLLQALKTNAQLVGGPSIALTFDPHPAALLRPDSAPKPLTWIHRRAFLLQEQGIDQVLVCRPTRELLAMSPRQFFDQILVDRLAAKAIVEGPNFFFGKDRSGDVETLKKLCQPDDIRLEIVEPTNSGDTMISSTTIRRWIALGQVEKANQWLSAPYRITGVVAKGAQRGSKLGFPTANLHDIPVLLPKAGVYAGRVIIKGKEFLTALNIGPNPTFDEGQCKVEAHLLDFSGDLYGEQIEVQLTRRIRDVIRFENVDSLLRQVQKDVTDIRNGL